MTTTLTQAELLELHDAICTHPLLATKAGDSLDRIGDKIIDMISELRESADEDRCANGCVCTPAEKAEALGGWVVTDDAGTILADPFGHDEQGRQEAEDYAEGLRADGIGPFHVAYVN